MKNLLLFVSICLLTKLNGQSPSFFKSYDIETESHFSNNSGMVLTYDSCYAIAFITYDSTYKNSKIELIKLNADGNFLWRQSYTCPTYVHNAAIVQAPDSGFVITSSYEIEADTISKIALIKTNKTGVKEWIKLYGDSTLDQTNSDLAIKGNEIFILSYGILKSGMPAKPNYFISRLDLNGNVIWYNSYKWMDGWAGWLFQLTFLINQNKEIVVSGESNDIFNNHFFGISKIDSNGYLLKSKLFVPSLDIEPWKMIYDENDDIVITGRATVLLSREWDIFLIKLDTLFNFKWMKTYGGNWWDEGYNIFQVQGGYVICAEPESFSVNEISRASLFQTDMDGNMQWMKIYGDTTGSYPNGSVQLNNGFVVYGIKGSFGSDTTVFLMKTDMSGVSSCKWESVTLPDSAIFLTSVDSGYSGNVQGVMVFDLVQDSKQLNAYDECKDDSICSLNIYIPNVMSPNSDRLNDYFNIIVDCYSNYHLRIFNRWGQKLFESFQSNSLWDGNDTAGNKVPDGTYYYLLTLNDLKGKEYSFKGFLTLIR